MLHCIQNVTQDFALDREFNTKHSARSEISRSPVDSSNVWDYLERDVGDGDLVHAEGLEQEDELDGEPGDGEHGGDHRDQLHHAPLVPHALPAGRAAHAGLQPHVNYCHDTLVCGDITRLSRLDIHYVTL